jgi:hypothetical protein
MRWLNVAAAGQRKLRGVVYGQNQIKENLIGGAYSTHGRDEKDVENFSWKA